MTIAVISAGVGALHHGDSGAGALEVASDANSDHHTHDVPGSLHHHGMAHTHGLNDPTGLYEAGMTRNVHLYVDDGAGGFTDVSTALGGPWDGSGSQFDVRNLDITQYIVGGGFREIQLSSTAIGAIKASVYIFGLLQSI